MPTAPNTLAIGQQIVSFLQALKQGDGVTPLYSLVQLEAIKDVVDLTSNGGVCCEVYGSKDTSDRRRFGGVIYDPQEWFILSLCSLDSPALAQQIYTVRDGMVQPFQQHAQLNSTPANVWFNELNPQMEFGRIYRNGTWLRSHLATLTTKQQWQVQGGIIS
jgi:hypothetical protein